MSTNVSDSYQTRDRLAVVATKRTGIKKAHLVALRKRILPWVLPISLLATWQFVTVYHYVQPQILPEPMSVYRAFVLLAHGELWNDILVSSGRAFTGFAIGGGLGLILGMLNGLVEITEEAFDTTVQLLRTVPTVALLPLIILWMGIGEPTKVILIAMSVFFPIYLNTFHGMRVADNRLVETGRVYGLKGFRLFRQVMLPAALPSIIVGFRFGLGAMWLALIFAEAIAAESGIGYLSTVAREYMQMDVVFVCILLYAFLGKAADTVGRILEHFLVPWKRI